MDARRIIVPLDGSALAEAALPVAEGLARRADTAFLLVRVAEAQDDLPDIMAARLDTVGAAKTYLETTAEGLNARDFDNGQIVTLHGLAAPAILEAARDKAPLLPAGQVNRRSETGAEARP
jgi:nucleotide-binding universal stress UspA family protein